MWSVHTFVVDAPEQVMVVVDTPKLVIRVVDTPGR